MILGRRLVGFGVQVGNSFRLRFERHFKNIQRTLKEGLDVES